MNLDKKIILESISLANFNKKNHQIYFDDLDFQLRQNSILSLVNKNNHIQNRIFEALTFENNFQNYQGFLIYDNNVLNTNKQNIKKFLNDISYGFHFDIIENNYYNRRLREYIEKRFDLLIKNKPNLQTEFNKKHIEIINEYHDDLELIYLNSLTTFFKNENKYISDFFYKYNKFEFTLNSKNFDEWLNIMNILITKSINNIQDIEQNLITNYKNYRNLLNENILLFNRQEILKLKNQISKNKIHKHKFIFKWKNYFTFRKQANVNNYKKMKVLFKIVDDILIKKLIYLHKFKIASQIDEKEYYQKRYISLKLLWKFLIRNIFKFRWLESEQIRQFLEELKKFINDFETLSFFDKKQKRSKKIQKQLIFSMKNQIITIFDEYNKIVQKNKKDYFNSRKDMFLKPHWRGFKKIFKKVDNVWNLKNNVELYKQQLQLRELELDFEWNKEQFKIKHGEFKNKIEFQLRKESNLFNKNYENIQKIVQKFEVKFNNWLLKNKDLKTEELLIKNLQKKYLYLKKQKEHLTYYRENLYKIFDVINNKKSSNDSEIAFLLKQFIYDFLDKYKLPKNILEKRIPNINNEVLINLELFELFYLKPKIILIGNLINELKQSEKEYVLTTTNKYILDNKISAIYFLDDINLAAKYSMDTIIFDNEQIIEKGKISSIIKSPIHPFTKYILKNNINQEILNSYFLNSSKFLSKQFFKIDKGHEIFCNWNNLISWSTQQQIKDKKIYNLLFNVEKKTQKNAEFKDSYELPETIIANFSTKEHEEKQKTMEKIFNHKLVEKNRYEKWVESKVFETHDQTKRPFTIILPPPNVTGVLHVGHALDTYIQDTVIRFKKMQGYDTLFLPAKDHAGIATQSKVEKLLHEQGISKHTLGREKFIEEVWKWKNKHSHLIDEQWKTLGLALDYSKERFTLDEEANKAVLKVFVTLYNKGLIYRGTKPIYWDPIQKTALSNIEVINEATNQKMYYIKYPFKDNENEYLEIATTRIETLFSDVAVAFNPDDSRYIKYLNKILIHPLTKKEIPIISDEYIDISFGSGLMKVSAHAVEDINIIEKNNLQINECINDDGLLNDLANEFKGLERIAAREKIAKKLEEEGYLIKVEDTVSNVGISERSGAVVEILVRSQWFLKMDEMSKMLLENLESENAVEFIPSRFKEVIKSWMEKTYDWTISRQLWWGHRIPAYYKGNQIIVSLENPGDDWVQDPDVLDTWFSSGLSPFVFLGWPNETEDFKHYFPTQLLVTGYDIIFFWVARMYFMSLEFNKQIPFKQVLLHGLVRDAQGRKLSKSLGNGIDPIKVIDEYGSDVLRISLLFNLTAGQDIHYSDQKLESSKLFVNKFWNIARYVKGLSIENDQETKNDAYDNWILERLKEFEQNLTNSMNKYDFSVSYKFIQKFLVNEFSGWYLEFAKFKQNTQLIHTIFKKILILMHPFLPFTTDYLYEIMYNENILEIQNPKIKYPSTKNTKAEKIIEIITELRKYRETKNISKAKVLFYATPYSKLTKNDKLIIEKLANFQYKENSDTLIQASDFTINILLDQETKDLEINRLNDLIKQNNIDIEFASKMLNNPKFIEKAKPEKVQEIKEKLAIFEAKHASYTEEIKKLQN
ncbi:valine--tRNA ligase [Mycoplasma zalophi]|uniref:valine--tRNA ligase n=1 Tax=Mycoplasma zalophi TaxID=191287 RepID=UPI00280AF5B8|nr:valine--tRNA ligase [Mycoplasma zalophi]